MKKKGILLTLMVLAIVLTALAACKGPAAHESNGQYFSDETYHWFGCKACDEHVYVKARHEFADSSQKKCKICQQTVQYSSEENAAYWLGGRDGTKKHAGAYSIKYTEEHTENGKLTRSETSESWDGGSKYFMMTKASELSGGNVSDLSEEERTIVLEPAVYEGITCARLFRSEYENGQPVRIARYVSPNYINRSLVRYFPAEQLADYGVDDCNDLAGIFASIQAFLREEEDIDAPPSITLTRNEDQSVTLQIAVSFEGTTDFEEEENFFYQQSMVLSLTAKDGKIVRAEDVIDTKSSYANPVNNTEERHARAKEISYEFNNADYSQINTTTDETLNAYYCVFSIRIAGFDNSYFYDDKLVGETVTAQDLADSILSRIGQFVGDFQQETVFELYTDPQLTTPFTSVKTERGTYEVYLKFVAPEGKSLVLTVFEKEEEGKRTESVKVVYLWKANEKFYPQQVFADYELLSVDGSEPVADGSFVCEAGKVHVVRYAG